jgi:hypothetical protein
MVNRLAGRVRKAGIACGNPHLPSRGQPLTGNMGRLFRVVTENRNLGSPAVSFHPADIRMMPKCKVQILSENYRMKEGFCQAVG